MKLIKPSVELIEQDWDLDSMRKHIEFCGRTCYKSTDKITDKSAGKFVERLIESKHYAMLEHGTIYLEIPDTDIYREMFEFYSNNKYSRYNKIDYKVYVTTNYRVIIENERIDDLAYTCRPTKYHVPRYTFKFICNRQVSHEFVRHRVFSFAQESTRYCNYTKDKFGNELTFIQPCWTYNLYDEDFDNSEDCQVLVETLDKIEESYFDLINIGWKPQQAATILPNAIKTELIMTGFDDADGWQHFIDLRSKGTTGAPHPQAKELADQVKEILNNLKK